MVKTGLDQEGYEACDLCGNMWDAKRTKRFGWTKPRYGLLVCPTCDVSTKPVGALPLLLAFVEAMAKMPCAKPRRLLYSWRQNIHVEYCSLKCGCPPCKARLVRRTVTKQISYLRFPLDRASGPER